MSYASSMADPRMPSYGIIDREFAMRLASTPPDDDGPVWMVNLMKYKEAATYDPDSSHAAATGREADDRYAPVEILADIGAEIVFAGDVEMQLLYDEPKWDRIGVVKYPTRRSFIEMQSREDFRDKHVHKEAGMDRTIVMACRPAAVPPGANERDRHPDWSTVPHPPTPDDGPIAVLHVLRFADGGREEMEQYQNHAAEIAVPHGVRIGAWFDVEGTIVGDGRSWDQVRFNLFPSKAAFMAVAADPARLAAQEAHRMPAIADTYALVLRPLINRLEGTNA